MKLTTAQLKQIIAEEIKKAHLTENVGMGTGSAELQTMLDVVCDGFKAQFDTSVGKKAVRLYRGKDVWDQQCETACEVLGEKIQELIMQVEEDLHNGRFSQE